MANDFTDPSGSIGRELGKLASELAQIKKTQLAQAAELKKLAAAQSSQPSRGSQATPTPSRASDERSVRGARTTADVTSAREATNVAKQRIAVTDELAASQARLARAEAQQTGALRTQILQSGGASQELRRRGALTTEAIQAAAAGTLTMRELGYQVGATIGKFAGWTLAAGATFAAVDAISQLGRGALDGAEGVNKLTRVINNVDTTKAHEQIRNLAESANQDLGTVGEGLFESGKVFNNQDDAEKLTRVALRAKNIGELEVSDAVRFLTSVVRGFKLEAGDAADVLDIFNNLQQKFGTDIRGGLQGGAQAAAQVLNAGGNLRQMSALIATIQRAGFSGSEAGVAIRRSSELIKRPGSINKERLAKFGIDSDQPLAKIYEQAVQLAESGKIKGPQINELATALVTPQLSPRFAAVLNRPDQFRRAEKIVSPASSYQSAEKEEKKFLASPIQQLKAIGVELGKLGDALGEAGVLQPLLAMAKALGESLEVLTTLVGLFNKLPGPIRTAVVLLAEFAAVTKLIRRFNPSDGTGVGRFGGFFQPTPNNTIKGVLKNDARLETSFYRNQQERLSQEATSKRALSINAIKDAQNVQARLGPAALAGDKSSRAAIAAAEQRALRATEEATRAEDARSRATKEYTRALSNEKNLRSQLRGPGRDPYTVARGLGYDTRSQTVATPTNLTPVPIGGAGGGAPPIYRQASQIRARNQGVIAQLKYAGGQGGAFTRTLNVLAASFGLAGRGMAGIPSAAKRAGDAGGRAGARIGVAAASLGALFGPAELIILGIISLVEGLNSAHQQAELLQSVQDNAKKKLSLQAAKAQTARAKAESDGGLGGFVASLPGRAKTSLTGPPGLEYESPKDHAVALAEDQERDARIRDRKKRARDLRLAEARQRQRASKVDEGFRPGIYDDEQLQQEIEALSTLGDLGRLGNRGIRDLTSAYLAALRRFAGSRNPDDIQKLSAAQQGFEQGIGTIQQDLESQLELAGSNQGLRRSAYQGAQARLRIVRQTARRNLQAARQRLRGIRDEAVKEQRAADADRRQQETAFGGFGDLGQLPETHLSSRIKQKRAKAKKQLSAAEKAFKEVQEMLKEIFNALAKAFNDGGDRFAKFDEQTDLIRQRADVTASGTLNTGSQLAARLNAANQNLSRARGLGNGPEAERRINDAIIERNNVLNEFANLAVQQLEATNAINVASAPTEQARIRAEITGAQAKLALLHSQGRGPEETNVVVAELIGLKKELNRQILEDANALAEASAEYAKSLTGSDVKEANIDLRLANTLLRNARKIEDPTERRTAVLQAKARKNEARGASVLTGFSTRYETVEYKARIGLISSGQELNLIQALLNSVTKKQLRTIDGMREFFRSLKERMKQLNDESNVEINPGSIKLPTFYDVRRLQRQGTNQAAAGSVQQQNSYTFNVADPASAEALGGALDGIHGTQTTAAMRAAGMI